jgi:hypothetical protein
MNLDKIKLLIVWAFFLLMVLISIGATYCHAYQGQTATNFIMMNNDFTNVNMWTRDRYQEVFGYAYSANDIDYVFSVFSNHRISPLVCFLVARKEGMPRDYYWLGCGIHLKVYGYKDFESQVNACANTLYSHFRFAKQVNYRAYLMEQKRYVTMWNDATYAFYRYTPYFKIYLKQTKQYHGNFVVRSIWLDLKEMMNRGTQ